MSASAQRQATYTDKSQDAGISMDTPVELRPHVCVTEEPAQLQGQLSVHTRSMMVQNCKYVVTGLVEPRGKNLITSWENYSINH